MRCCALALFVIVLLAGAGRVSAQIDSLELEDTLVADITTRQTAVMVGYVYQGLHFLRLGLGRISVNDRVYPGKHAAAAITATLSLNADLRVSRTRFVVAPTLSWHTSFVWLLVGADLSYVSDFKHGGPLLRLNLGVGFWTSPSLADR